MVPHRTAPHAVCGRAPLVQNLTDLSADAIRSSAFRPYKLSSAAERAGSGGVKRDYTASAPISPRRRSSEVCSGSKSQFQTLIRNPYPHRVCHEPAALQLSGGQRTQILAMNLTRLPRL